MRVLAIGCMILFGAVAPPAAAQEYFHGYSCTEDCSGHEAGYQWAEDHDITDPDDCGGDSNSFIEGCKAYADEHSEDVPSDDDSSSDNDDE